MSISETAVKIFFGSIPEKGVCFPKTQLFRAIFKVIHITLSTRPKVSRDFFLGKQLSQTADEHG